MGIVLEDEKRRKILDFVLGYWNGHGKVPPVRAIVDGTKTHPNLLYSLFPGGMRQICEEMGLPVPVERIIKMQNISCLGDRGKITSDTRRNRYDDEYGNFKNDLLELETKIKSEDMVAAHRYASILLNYHDSEVLVHFWKLMKHYDVALEKAIAEAFGSYPSYIEMAERAYVKTRKEPAVKQYVIDVLSSWARRCTDVYEPVMKSRLCPTHGKPLMVRLYSGVFILECKGISLSLAGFDAALGQRMPCEVCGQGLELLEDRWTARCVSCGAKVRYGAKPEISREPLVRHVARQEHCEDLVFWKQRAKNLEYERDSLIMDKLEKNRKLFKMSKNLLNTTKKLYNTEDDLYNAEKELSNTRMMLFVKDRNNTWLSKEVQNLRAEVKSSHKDVKFWRDYSFEFIRDLMHE